MEELSSHGRTVLFVSHQMQVLARLCDRAILLREGRVVQDGPSEQVVAHYLQAEGGAGSLRTWPDLATAPGGKRVRMREVRVVDENGRLADSVDIRRPVGIEISFTILRDDVPVFPKVKLIDREGNNAFNTVDTNPLWSERPVPGDYVATAWIPGNLLNEGLYTVEPGVSSLGAIGSNKLVHQVRVPDAVAFHVYDPGEGDTSKGRFAGQFRGAVRPLLEWTSERR
jgi:lipopolysaccharide transport system ATP-binding protein